MKVALLGGAIVAIGLFDLFGQVNTSSSVPLGLYVDTNQQPRRGDFALFCAPDAAIAKVLAKESAFDIGPCYHHSMAFLKIVAAVGGDVVDVSAESIVVNGIPWPNSVRPNADCDRTPVTEWLAYGKQVVPAGSVLMLGTNMHSYDGRVYGLIPISSIRSKVIPIVTLQGDSSC